ncbi:hypothetical protein BR93DRAFT_977327 [Coniochaeta sp. PMI_546]|nr:hypothetical protein BR93DRAFT_977327 [Coniochaeta sp. PMI_546]
MTRLDSTQRAEAFDATIQILYDLFPTQEHAQSLGFRKVSEQGDTFYPHVIAALAYLHHRGLYETALPYFDIAIRIYSRERENNLKYLAFLQGTAGNIYRNTDNAAKAVEYFREEINLLEEAVNVGNLEENPERLAYAYEHMAVAVQQLGDYDTAFLWHGKSLHILENFHAADRSGILLGHVNRSWALWKSGAWMRHRDYSSWSSWKLRRYWRKTAMIFKPVECESLQERAASEKS